MPATNKYRGSWEDLGFSPLAHSLLRGRISGRVHPDPGLACALNSPLHQTRCLGLFNELADIGESSSLVLRYRHRKAVGPVEVLQHP